MPRLQRYAVAGVGPFSGALAQFLLSLLVLRSLGAAEFGTFSFLIIASIFSAGVCSALFCAPLPALLHKSGQAERAALLRCIFAMSGMAALLALAVFLGMGLALRLPFVEALLFAIYAALFLLRWFGRSYFYAIGDRLRTARSDIVYSAVLLVGIGGLAATGRVSLQLSFAVLLVSILAALLTFGLPYLQRQFLSFYPAAFADYRPIWRAHSGWSLLGIVTTEATINSHAYIVTLIAGPTAYAPVAATALLVRPLNVLQNALEEFERPQMAAELAGGRMHAVIHSAAQFRLVLFAGLLATALAAAVMFVLFPNVLFPREYSMAVLITGAALWIGAAAVRLVRVPDSTMLQAGGEFRRLAWSSVVACGFSIVSVLFLLALAGPIWSIGGIIIGEIAFCTCVLHQSRRWRSSPEGANRRKALATSTPRAGQP
ncbi:hypothetical protein [Altererythrobacter sp. B11]|uniref:hypothetical protein n=1 Tax=Altererythrobacter sp. B11 TaxID=2060312 RepID=UPI0011AE65B5|nr:hypothetical protein [Altererythrobacter sp. B11]